MILSDIELQTVLNNLLLNLYKVNKGTHLNFNGNLKINLGEFNNRLFENLVLNINFFEEKITLSKSTLYLKKIGKISFSEPTFFERNQKLFLNTRIRFDIFDQNQLFKRFQIPKKNRRDLTKVYFELEYNVDDSEYFLSDINYDDKVKEDNNFYEVNNIQQLTNLISKEFEEISKD